MLAPLQPLYKPAVPGSVNALPLLGVIFVVERERIEESLEAHRARDALQERARPAPCFDA